MTRYRLRPLVSDWDGEDLWVGALPHGPITRIQGVGALVLELMAAGEQEDWSVAELVARLRELVEAVPEGAEEVVDGFLAELAEGGILERVEAGS